MEEEDIGNFDVYNIGDDYYVNSIKDLKKYINRSKNVNTLKKTDSAVKKLTDYLQTQGFPVDVDILKIKAEHLDILLGNWLSTCKRDDNQEYEPDSLTSLHRGVERYLRDNSYSYNILTDKEFQNSREALKAKRSYLKGEGKGNKCNQSEALTYEDEDQMWGRGALGIHDPEVLQETTWFILSKSLGFRGCQESRQLTFGDLEKKTDDSGYPYYEWTEKMLKTRQGNSGSRPFQPKVFSNKEGQDPERCPVKIIDEFISHRPANMSEDSSPFFLQVKRQRKADDRIWYKSQPLGQNSLSEFMKNLVRRADIAEGCKLTNHSIRKTCCSRLLEAGVPDTSVAQLSGHKNV